MKRSILLALLLALPTMNASPQPAPSAITGPYLGQKPPGSVPEMFGPGVISVAENFEHSAAVFSPDGNEVFWCTNVGLYSEDGRQGMLRLYFMKQADGRWSEPQLAPFAKNLQAERPVFAPDGESLYFEIFNPAEDDVDIFVVHRTVAGWSDPEPVSPLINSPAIERLHCVTADGSLYFMRNLMRPDEKIFVAKWVDGAFAEPEELGPDFNSEDAEVALLVAPDEDYMLISQNDRRTSTLTISFRNEDGSWSERIKVPYYCGGFLALSPDGKYLFMLTEDIYWVDTSFVDKLRP